MANTSKMGTYHPGNIVEKNIAPRSLWGVEETTIVDNEILYLKSFKTDTIIHYIDSNDVDYGKWTIPYSTGWIDTSDSFNIKYGYFEISCKIPKGEGYWPAFWLASNHSWPPEIDMFEFWTDKKWWDILKRIQRKLKSGIYLGNKNNTTNLGKGFLNIRKAHTILPKYITETFNKYAVEWDENGVKFYFNDILIFFDSIKSKQMNVYDMHIILNQGVTENVIKVGEKYMDDFEIKYVKVYKKLKTFL